MLPGMDKWRRLCWRKAKVMNLPTLVLFVKVSLLYFPLSHGTLCGRYGGLMVSALISGLRSPGLSPGWGHCVVFLGKTLYSRSASFHPGVYCKWVQTNSMLEVALWWTSIPPRGGVLIRIVALCYRNWEYIAFAHLQWHKILISKGRWVIRSTWPVPVFMQVVQIVDI